MPFHPLSERELEFIRNAKPLFAMDPKPLPKMKIVTKDELSRIVKDFEAVTNELSPHMPHIVIDSYVEPPVEGTKK